MPFTARYGLGADIVRRGPSYPFVESHFAPLKRVFPPKKVTLKSCRDFRRKVQ
jgi:hypothetical protein